MTFTSLSLSATDVVGSSFNLLNTTQQHAIEHLYLAYHDPDAFRRTDHPAQPLPFQPRADVKSNFGYLSRVAQGNAAEEQGLKRLFTESAADTILGRDVALPELAGITPLDTFRHHCQRMLVLGVADQARALTSGRLQDRAPA